MPSNAGDTVPDMDFATAVLFCCINCITTSAMALMFSGVSNDFRSKPPPPAGAGGPAGAGAGPPPLFSNPPSKLPAMGSRLLSNGINAANDIGALNGVSSKENDRLLLLV